VDEVIDCCSDVTVAVGKSMREPDEAAKMKLRAELATEILPKWFKAFEALLTQNAAKNNESPWFVGKTLTCADLCVWRMMGWLTGGVLDGIPTTVAEPFPRLCAAVKAVDNYPKVEEWKKAHPNNYK